jgi:dTDP-4-dehydrorhamnose reductase
MMKTLLLGPNGQLGTDIQSANLQKGEPLSIVPVGRAIVDLTDFEATARFLRGQDFACLINCSSYHKTDEVEKNAPLAYTINAHLVQKLAEICREKNARFVHISTDYVFGGQAERTPLTESARKAPVNVYGASKDMGEELAERSGADLLVLRVASLFGVAGASGKGGNFVETMIRLAKEKGALRIVADQTMSPTATADIAEVLIRMLQENAAPGVWHVVNSGQATWCDFARRIVERCGIAATVAPITSVEFPTAAKRPPYSVLDNAKVSAAFGPMRSWQDALDSYLVAKGHRAK